MEAAWGRMEVVGKCRAEDGCGLRAIPAGTERGGYCRALPSLSSLCDCTVGYTCISVPLVTMTAAGPSSAGDGQALLSFTHPNLLTFPENPQGSGTIPVLRGYVPCPRPHSKQMADPGLEPKPAGPTAGP